MTSTENTASLTTKQSIDSLGEAISYMQNTTSLGGRLWLAFNSKDLPWQGKAVLFSCKTGINYLETAFGLYIYYLIFFRPYAVRPHIDAASLAAFELGPGNDTLRYDLAVNVTFWSDHRIWAIRYNHFTARLFFNDTQIGPPDDTFPKFKGRTRRHRTLYPLLRGRARKVSAAVAEELSLQRARGWFTLEVRLRAKLTYVIWPTRYHYYYEYDCWVAFPSIATATAKPAIDAASTCSKGKRFGLS